MYKLVNQILDNIIWPAVFVVFFWLVYFVDVQYNLNLNQFGINPKSAKGLIGVITSPFLHGDFGHLFSNTVPFLVSSAFVIHFFFKESPKIFAGIWLISGLGVWFFGDSWSIHIGASGLVYGLVTFLLVSGIIRKNQSLAAVALILVFLYGSMVWGLFPQFNISGNQVSWEGHLFGTISGIAMAFTFRKHGPSDDPDPFEGETEEDMPEWWKRMKEEEEIQEIVKRHHEQKQLGNTSATQDESDPANFRIVYKPKNHPD
jgi:membrane associated rhomboid family serine protease